jgi:hypothetical protein
MPPHWKYSDLVVETVLLDLNPTSTIARNSAKSIKPGPLSTGSISVRIESCNVENKPAFSKDKSVGDRLDDFSGFIWTYPRGVAGAAVVGAIENTVHT